MSLRQLPTSQLPQRLAPGPSRAGESAMSLPQLPRSQQLLRHLSLTRRESMRTVPGIPVTLFVYVLWQACVWWPVSGLFTRSIVHLTHVRGLWSLACLFCFDMPQLHVLKSKGLEVALSYPTMGAVVALTPEGYPCCFETGCFMEGGDDVPCDSELEEPSSEVSEVSEQETVFYPEDATRLTCHVACVRPVSGCFRVACVRPGFMVPVR